MAVNNEVGFVKEKSDNKAGHRADRKRDLEAAWLLHLAENRSTRKSSARCEKLPVHRVWVGKVFGIAGIGSIGAGCSQNPLPE